ncbi:MAG TPA: RHS repeat-associated core domain-containing protein [Pyrinomonadaceae bacterium]|nr:RHS repeat-associated core domain-containing protein [Pyrinomonadaceae bacterium]
MKRLSAYRTLPTIFKSGGICVVVLCFLSVGLRVHGQVAEFTQNGAETRTVTLQVPLAEYPGRGGSVPVRLTYSTQNLWRIGFINTIPMGSSVWRSVTEAIYAEHSTAGWTTSLDVPKVEWPRLNDIYWYTGKAYPKGTVSPFTYRVAQLYMHMPDGSSYEMRKQDAVYQDTGSISMTGTFYSVDGSRMRYDSTGQNTGILYLPDGTRYILGTTAVQRIDRNGNTLNYDVSSRQWTDTMGRVIGMPWPANPGPGNYTYSVPAFNNTTIDYVLKFQSLSNTLTPGSPNLRVAADYYLPDPNSAPTGPGGANFPQANSNGRLFNSAYADPEETTQSYTYVVGRGQSAFATFNPTVLAEIVMPNGQSYKFSYNIYGELDKVIYPTGGYQRYQYAAVPSIGVLTDPYTQGSRGMISRWISASGTGTDEAQWTYSQGLNPMTVTAPDGTRTEIDLFIGTSFSENFGYKDARQGAVSEERIYAPAAQGGAMLRRNLYSYGVTTSMTAKPTPNGVNNPGSYTAYRNSRMEKAVNIILDTGGNALAKTTTFGYIDNGYQFSTGLDQNSITETHFASVDPTTAQSGVITSIQAGTTATRVENTFLDNATYRNRNILGLPTTVIIKGIILGTLQTVAQTQSFYDEVAYPVLTYGDLTGSDYIDPGTSARGNTTTIRRHVDVGTNVYLDTHAQFDQAGNLRKAWNERQVMSEMEYSSTYKHAFLTQTTTAAPDPSGVFGSNAAFISGSTFDYTTGLVLTATDINGQVTSYSYKDDQNNNDPLNRLRKVTRPDGGWTKYSFGDTVGNVFTLTEVQQDASRVVKSYQYFDPIGRLSRQFAGEGGTNYIATDNIYDQMGRIWKVSNPYRTTTLDGVADLAHTSYWSVSAYDPLGRVISVTYPDSSVVQTSYQGAYMTVTDQAGKQKRQKTDALGQVVRVDEPNVSGSLGTVDAPTQATSYEYDTQGNMVHISQGSSPVQHRYFKYDALGRLTHELQVEQAGTFSLSDPVTGNSSWSRKLLYDETIASVTYSGLLTRAYDARNVETAFRYDNLNRIYQINYSDGTPTVTNKYDQYRGATYFNKGHVTEALTAAAGSIPATGQLTNFDRMGRVVNNQQTVGSQTYDMAYGYNLGGILTSQTYPSGRVVSYTFDDGARLSQVSSGATVYASNYDYSSPTGLLKSLTLGNNAVESYVYNSRLQLQSLDLTRSGSQIQHFDYKYGVYNPSNNTLDETKNNGQIAQIEGFINTQKQWQQRFTYDTVGRLGSAREFRGDNSVQSYLVNYDYDVFGNRYLKQAQNGGNPFTQIWVETADVNQATNRFSAGATYDAAGNVTNDSKFRNRKFQYDANNRQKQSRNLDDTGAVDSIFDANGQRVATQIAGSLTNVQVYDAMGKLLAEYSLTTAQGGTQFVLNDHQGPRTITGTSGAVIARHDYLPFGDDLLNNVGMRTAGQGYGGTEAARQKYAAMENDEATGLSHTLWRKYDSLSARWTTPDPYIASMTLTDPQTFNRYSYVNNDPLNHVDPAGLALADIGVYQTSNPAVASVLEGILLRMFRQQTAPNQGQSGASGGASGVGARIEQEIGPPPPVPKLRRGSKNSERDIKDGDTIVTNTNAGVERSYVNLVDKVDHYGDKRVPLGGQFEIIYIYVTSVPLDDSVDLGDAGKIEPVTTANGTVAGTFESANLLERVGTPIVKVDKKNESVRVTKTERFKVREDATRASGGTWVINYAVVVTNPNSGDVHKKSSINSRDIKPVPVISVRKNP